MYMGLVTILITILTSIFLTALETQLASQASSSSLTTGRFFLTRLEYDLRRASSVTSPVTLGEASPSLAIVVDGNTLIYSQDSGNLTLTIAGDTRVLNDVGTVISNLEFTRLGNAGGKATILVTLTVMGNESHPPEIRSFETAIGLR